jgi:hypothetical protein
VGSFGSYDDIESVETVLIDVPSLVTVVFTKYNFHRVNGLAKHADAVKAVSKRNHTPSVVHEILKI